MATSEVRPEAGQPEAPPSADELRANLKARVKDEALADPRVKTLERWALRLPDDEVADAIELIEIGLDAPRQARWEVLRIIDDELRRRGAFLPHPERVAFLRWIVRSRETDAKIRAKLGELHDAPTTKARAKIIGLLTEADVGSIANAHTTFAHAWRAAPSDARPRGDAHRGEPEPMIGARNSVRLAIWLARRVEHLVPRSDRKVWSRLMKLAEAAARAGKASVTLRQAPERAPREGAVSLARSACMEARATLLRPDMAGVATRPAAVKVVGLLLEAHGNEAVRAFLGDLDHELRRLDVVHAVGQRNKLPSRPIARAIYRAAEKGKVVLWLAELEGGKLGLLSKQGRLWSWNEGGRDDVLATIPDAWFEHAVMAARDAAIA
jgi:hypothetical protein